jgi:zinc transport system substrate-binding protein
MKKTLFIAALAALLLGAGCANQTTPNSPLTAQRLKVAATIFALADIAQNVGGDRADVMTLLPPGASPHTFEPTPDLIKKLQDAKILFMIGHGLDDWAVTLAQSVPGLTLVVVDTGIKLRAPGSAPAIGFHDEDGQTDPHYWLDAGNGQKIAATIADNLERSDPDNAAAYRENLAKYQNQIAHTDETIRDLLKPHAGAKLITHHDAWQYFAAAYGLVIAGSFEPSPGKNLTPKELAALEDLIRKEKIKTLFIEPQLSNQIVKPVADDLKLNIRKLDPEGGTAKSYLDLMETNARTIAESL